MADAKRGVGRSREGEGTEKQMMRAIEIIFCLLFIFCGCSIDSICDSGSSVWLLVAFFTLVFVAAVMGHEDN